MYYTLILVLPIDRRPFNRMEVAFSVLDFEKGRNGIAGPITSPRSLDACLRAGYDPSELLPAFPESFSKSLDGKRQLTKEEQMKRYEHFESRRLEKIRTVKEVREAIITSHMAKNTHKVCRRTCFITFAKHLIYNSLAQLLIIEKKYLAILMNNVSSVNM